MLKYHISSLNKPVLRNELLAKENKDSRNCTRTRMAYDQKPGVVITLGQASPNNAEDKHKFSKFSLLQAAMFRNTNGISPMVFHRKKTTAYFKTLYSIKCFIIKTMKVIPLIKRVCRHRCSKQLPSRTGLQVTIHERKMIHYHLVGVHNKVKLLKKQQCLMQSTFNGIGNFRSVSYIPV